MPEPMSASERNLRDAMNRLLTGTAERTDGRLIKENLYREAGVSRATMNRTKSVLDEWAMRVDGTQPRDREVICHASAFRLCAKKGSSGTTSPNPTRLMNTVANSTASAGVLSLGGGDGFTVIAQT